MRPCPFLARSFPTPVKIPIFTAGKAKRFHARQPVIFDSAARSFRVVRASPASYCVAGLPEAIVR